MNNRVINDQKSKNTPCIDGNKSSHKKIVFPFCC